MALHIRWVLENFKVSEHRQAGFDFCLRSEERVSCKLAMPPTRTCMPVLRTNEWMSLSQGLGGCDLDLSEFVLFLHQDDLFVSLCVVLNRKMPIREYHLERAVSELGLSHAEVCPALCLSSKRNKMTHLQSTTLHIDWIWFGVLLWTVVFWVSLLVFILSVNLLSVFLSLARLSCSVAFWSFCVPNGFMGCFSQISFLSLWFPWQFVDLCILLGCDYCDSIRGE